MYSVLDTLLEHTYFTYQKTLLHMLFCMFLKSSKAFSISFRRKSNKEQSKKFKKDFSLQGLEISIVLSLCMDQVALVSIFFLQNEKLSFRGRYSIRVYPTFIQLHGKTYDYKIPHQTVLRLFLLPHQDNRFMFFVVSSMDLF